MKYFLTLLITIATLLISAPANAQPVVSNGVKITPTLEFEGYCTLGAVGYDHAGNKVGITAGHCDAYNGGPLYLHDTKQHIGEFVYSNHDPSFDYAVVKLDDNVFLSSNGPNLRVDQVGSEAQFGEILCKDGRTTGVTCGLILSWNNGLIHGEILTTGYMWQGDSGGPLVRGTELVGIASKLDYALPPFEFISIHKILNDIPYGQVGSGFYSVNN